MENVNEYILKISSAGVALPEGLELSKRYLLSTEVDITDINKKDNQDGTVNLIYRGRQTGNIEILTEGKRIIKADAKKKVSQSIHGAIWHYHNNNGIVEPFEVFYEREGRKIAAYMGEILEFLKTKN